MAKKVQHIDNENEFDTLITVVLDCSGSMQSRVGDVIGNYNWFIDQQKAIGRAKVSLHRFDTSYETIYEDKDINDVPELTTNEYFARGGTALLDAVGKTIKAIDKIKSKPDKIIVVINTDGQENSSQKHNLAQIKELVTERTNNHDWQFVFMGAGIDAFADGGAMGFTNYSAFAASPAGYSSSTHSLNRSITSYRTGETATVDMNSGTETTTK